MPRVFCTLRELAYKFALVSDLRRAGLLPSAGRFDGAYLSVRR